MKKWTQKLTWSHIKAQTGGQYVIIYMPDHIDKMRNNNPKVQTLTLFLCWTSELYRCSNSSKFPGFFEQEAQQAHWDNQKQRRYCQREDQWCTENPGSGMHMLSTKINWVWYHLDCCELRQVEVKQNDIQAVSVSVSEKSNCMFHMTHHKPCLVTISLSVTIQGLILITNDFCNH